MSVGRGRALASLPVDFEKWQALGNDYLIVEERALPWPLTPPRVQALCADRTGVGADGILLLSPPAERGFVARLRIFNPDGSEAELSGNGAREAVLYLRRRGWVEADVFSIETAAGEIRPHITGPGSCRVDMGRARLAGEGDVRSVGREWRYRHVRIGNPQTAIRVASETELASLALAAAGPPVETDPRFPERTNVSFWTITGPGRIRARIWERGVGETLASGTGACGAAVAYVEGGGDSPVTVELDGGTLEAEVGEDLSVILSGTAAPVYAGTLSAEESARIGALA